METPFPSSPSEVRPEDFAPPQHEVSVHKKDTLSRVGSAALKFTDHVVEAGQAHPRTAAVVLLGTGMLLGSLVHRLAQPPTTSRRIARTLQRGAINASRLLLDGFDAARHMTM